MKYGVHKIWFTYNDEWYITNDNPSTQIGTYETLSEAEKAYHSENIRALKNLGSDDYIRDLTGFMENNNYKERVQDLVEFARKEGWNTLTERKYSNSEELYFELGIPDFASNEQLSKVLEITGAYFCKIIEYQDIKKSAYIKFNHNFWGNKIFKVLKDEGVIEDRSPFIEGNKNKGKYFVQKPPKGRKSATIRNIEQALEEVATISINKIVEFDKFSFITKTYFDDLSESPQALMAYIEGIKNIKVIETPIDESNSKAYEKTLRKLNSQKSINQLDSFKKIEFIELDNLATKEILGFFELLKIKPFSVYEMISEVNGEKVKSYYPDYYTI